MAKINLCAERGVDMSFTNQILPFSWLDYDNGKAGVSLYAGEQYKKELFATRKKEGFSGNGYDWESLAQIFIQEKAPDLQEQLEFDSERGMFCVYSSDRDALERFIRSFKEACENNDLIVELFSRAIPEKPPTEEDFKNVLALMGFGKPAE